MEGTTNVMDHLEREGSRAGANIRCYFFHLFFSFKTNHCEEKNETVAQRVAQITETGEERKSNKRYRQTKTKSQLMPNGNHIRTE